MSMHKLFDKNGHAIDADGNLVYDLLCSFCEPLADAPNPHKSHDLTS